MGYGNMIAVSNMARSKLATIQTAIRSNRAFLVCDFDDTMTDSISKSKFPFKSHWNAVYSLLKQETREKYSSICAEYYEKYCDGTISVAEELCWPNRTLGLLQEEKISRNLLIEAAKLIIPRKNLNNLINLFGTKNCIIISFGIYDVIEEFLKLNNFEGMKIFAAQGIFDPKGIFLSPRQETIVIPSKKGEILREFCRNNFIPEHYLMVVGDSKGDESMFLPDSLNVVVGNNNPPEMQNSDIVLVNNNFCTLVNYLNNYNGQRKIY